MTEYLKIEKDRVIKASEECVDAKRILKLIFPGAFVDEAKDTMDTLTPEFKAEARKHLSKLWNLCSITEDKREEKTHKGFWIVCEFLRSYVPALIYDEARVVGMDYILDKYEDYKLRNE